jgi:3-oxoacyl-[acyl-carrier protein] reductase
MSDRMPEERVCVITGGGTGTGAACARQLAAKGWRVVVNYSRSETEALETVAACEAAGQGDRVPEPLAVNEP